MGTSLNKASFRKQEEEKNKQSGWVLLYKRVQMWDLQSISASSEANCSTLVKILWHQRAEK